VKQQKDDAEIDETKAGLGKQQTGETEFKQVPGRMACFVCGLKNHTTEECRRNLFCELCGFANHTTTDWKREPFWNVGPDLCAAQVTNQSFFYIDENIDPKASREKASTAIITVSRGVLTSKQIET
jgi:rubredoxin